MASLLRRSSRQGAAGTTPQTLVPDATLSNVGWAVTGTSMHAALADASDATLITGTDSDEAEISFGNTAQAGPFQATLTVRACCTGVPAEALIYIIDDAFNEAVDVTGVLTPTDFVFGPVAMTAAEVNALQLVLQCALTGVGTAVCTRITVGLV